MQHKFDNVRKEIADVENERDKAKMATEYAQRDLKQAVKSFTNNHLRTLLFTDDWIALSAWREKGRFGASERINHWATYNCARAFWSSQRDACGDGKGLFWRQIVITIHKSLQLQSQLSLKDDETTRLDAALQEQEEKLKMSIAKLEAAQQKAEELVMFA